MFKVLVFAALLTGGWSQAAAVNTYTLTITNVPVTSNTAVIAGKTLTWTNATTSTTILTNSASVNGSATNLYNQLGGSPIGGVAVRMSSTNALTLRGTGLAISQSGNWCSLVLDSRPATNTYSLTIPLENLPTPEERTNDASITLRGLAKYATNRVDPNAFTGLGDYLNTTSGSQTKTGAVTIGTVSGGIGNLSNGTLRATSISGAAYDGGTVGLTTEVDLEQVTLTANSHLWFKGPSGSTNALVPTDSGLSLYNGRNTSTPLDVRVPDDPAALINFWSAIRIFPNLQSGTWIGTNIWGIQNDWFGTLNVFHEQLGATNLWAVNTSLTNNNFSGTNQWKGDVAWVHGTYSSMANTNNTIPAFTNAVVDLSGSTTSHDIAGAAGGRAGLRIRYWDSGTLPLTIRNLGGGASAGNRIRTRTGNDVTLTNNPAGFELEYSATASEWLYVPLGN